VTSVVECHSPEEVEIRAAVHLPLEVLDLANLALDGAAAVGEGEPGQDGGVVAFEAAGEGVECGQRVGADAGDLFVEAVTLAFGHHGGEFPDVSGGGRQFRAAGCDLGEPGWRRRRPGGRAGS
jgi:hypothetical protein